MLSVRNAVRIGAIFTTFTSCVYNDNAIVTEPMDLCGTISCGAKSKHSKKKRKTNHTSKSGSKSGSGSKNGYKHKVKKQKQRSEAKEENYEAQSPFPGQTGPMSPLSSGPVSSPFAGPTQSASVQGQKDTLGKPGDKKSSLDPLLLYFAMENSKKEIQSFDRENHFSQASVEKSNVNPMVDAGAKRKSTTTYSRRFKEIVKKSADNGGALPGETQPINPVKEDPEAKVSISLSPDLVAYLDGSPSKSQTDITNNNTCVTSSVPLTATTPGNSGITKTINSCAVPIVSSSCNTHCQCSTCMHPASVAEVSVTSTSTASSGVAGGINPAYSVSSSVAGGMNPACSISSSVASAFPPNSMASAAPPNSMASAAPPSSMASTAPPTSVACIAPPTSASVTGIDTVDTACSVSSSASDMTPTTSITASSMANSMAAPAESMANSMVNSTSSTMSNNILSSPTINYDDCRPVVDSAVTH